MLLFSAFKPDARWPQPIQAIYACLEPFRIVNGYGLFRVMTKERAGNHHRRERRRDRLAALRIQMETGRLESRAALVAPHQPRLDWQMWFAALGDYRQNPWFVGLVLRLLENSPDVTQLLASNPFPKSRRVISGPISTITISPRWRNTAQPEHGGNANDRGDLSTPLRWNDTTPGSPRTGSRRTAT